MVLLTYMRYLKVFVVLVFILAISCSTKEQDFGRALIEAKTIDDAIGIAKKCEKLEAKSLPIFIKTLEVLIDKEYHLENYGKISVCLNSLHNLAKKSISSKEEAIFLVQFIQKQTLITDTLVTVEILKLITGTDVGWNKEFVEHYTPNDEGKGKQMILEWEKAIEEWKNLKTWDTSSIKIVLNKK